MVLHNDKWARKAKKAVERRKGTNSSRGRGRGTTVPNTLERLDMNRPADEVEENPSEGSDSSDGDDSFEFDSGDEGKFLDAELIPPVVPTQSASQQSQTLSNTNQERQYGNTSQSQPARVPSAPGNATTSSTHADLHNQSPKPDKRFARRKLVDNSSRYEEPVLDPYLVVAEPEPEIDYHSLTSRQFTNPKEVELVPDEKSVRRTPQLMDDKTHFEKLKQMQQKEEYARDMKRRFGQRSGFVKMSGQGVHAAGDVDDNDFFKTIDTKTSNNVVSDSESKQGLSRTEQQGGSTRELDHMEKFLDDLLKI